MLEGSWPNLRGIQTTTGTFLSGYIPGNVGAVEVVKPDNTSQRFKTEGLADWMLTAEDGQITIRYFRYDGTAKVPVRLATGLACGEPVGAHTTGGLGPAGPAGAAGPKGDKGDRGPQGPAGAKGDDAMALTGEQMDQLSRLTAERVWDVPPRADNNGLPEAVRFGTRPQQDIAIMFLNQAFLQYFGMTLDEAAANLQAAIKAGTYVPKTLP